MIEWFELNVAEAARPYVLLIGALVVGALAGYLVAATLLSAIRRVGARAARRSAEARAAEQAAAGDAVEVTEDPGASAIHFAESVHRNLARPIRWAGAGTEGADGGGWAWGSEWGGVVGVGRHRSETGGALDLGGCDGEGGVFAAGALSGGNA